MADARWSNRPGSQGGLFTVRLDEADGLGRGDHQRPAGRADRADVFDVPGLTRPVRAVGLLSRNPSGAKVPEPDEADPAGNTFDTILNNGQTDVVFTGLINSVVRTARGRQDLQLFRPRHGAARVECQGADTIAGASQESP